MYERFTDRARMVMQLADLEARRFNHEYIGTEHILLGLVKEGSGVAAHVLTNLNVDLNKIRHEVEKIVQRGPDMEPPGKLPWTPRARKALEYAIEEANTLNQHVGTEHLLLGLIREYEGVGAQVLMNMGLQLDQVRTEVTKLLGTDPQLVSPSLPPTMLPLRPVTELIASPFMTFASDVATTPDTEESAMYERFTDRARRVMQLANQEAQRFNHEYIGTEHILLGLVKEGSGVAANVLKNLDIDLRKVWLEVEKIVQSGPDMVAMGKLPQTPRAKKVIEYAIEEARNLNHRYVGTEHLLLGLIREQEGVGAEVLMNLGLQLDQIRDEVISLLGVAPQLTSPNRPIRPPLTWPPKPPILDVPAKIKPLIEDLDKQIKQWHDEKEQAVADQDFELAARLRDQQDKTWKKQQQVMNDARREFVVDPAWLIWHDGTVPKIAAMIHELKRWENLPILGDALEDAGCTNDEMLQHCRQPGEHSHQCWVIDALLEKK